MELQAVVQVRIARAPRELLERVVLQRIEAAEAAQPVRVGARPVPLVQSFSALTFSYSRVDRSGRAAIDVGDRQHGCTLDAGGVEQPDELRRHRSVRRPVAAAAVKSVRRSRG